MCVDVHVPKVCVQSVYEYPVKATLYTVHEIIEKNGCWNNKMRKRKEISNIQDLVKSNSNKKKNDYQSNWK